MQSTLIDQALELLVFGMGTVFVFLIMLVIAVNLMSRFIETFFPEPVPPELHPPFSERTSDDLPNPQTLAAIQAAIHQHRAKQSRD
jgi:oxaloacetate decarboxylase gamma subunit